MHIALTKYRLLEWTNNRWLPVWPCKRLSRWSSNSGLPRWYSSNRLSTWLESRWPHSSWVHQKVLHKDGNVDGNLIGTKVGTEFGSQEQILIYSELHDNADQWYNPRLKLTQIPRTNSEVTKNIFYGVLEGIPDGTPKGILDGTTEGMHTQAYRVGTGGTDTYGQYEYVRTV